MLRTNKISVKSHLQTAAKYKCTFAIRGFDFMENNRRKLEERPLLDAALTQLERVAHTNTHACGQR